MAEQAVAALQAELERVKGIMTQTTTELRAEADADRLKAITAISDATASLVILQGQQSRNAAAGTVLEQAVTELKDQQVRDEAAGNNLRDRLIQLEQRASTPSSGDPSGKGWQLTRPKDLVPDIFSGKDEAWLQWKEATEDYAEAVHPGLKHAMARAAKVPGEIRDRDQLEGVEEKKMGDENQSVHAAQDENHE